MIRFVVVHTRELIPNPNLGCAGSSFPGSYERKPSLISTFLFVFFWTFPAHLGCILLALPSLSNSIARGSALFPIVPYVTGSQGRDSSFVTQIFVIYHASRGCLPLSSKTRDGSELVPKWAPKFAPCAIISPRVARALSVKTERQGFCAQVTQ